jgi:hypothetical protein
MFSNPHSYIKMAKVLILVTHNENSGLCELENLDLQLLLIQGIS